MSYHRRMPLFAGILVALLGLAACPAAAGEPEAFTRLKQLEGDWVGQEDDGSPVWASYRVLAAGTALVEVLKMGATDSMLSVYYPDVDQVMMTHYCTTGNQPRMRTRAVRPGADELDLEYVDATNVLRSTGGMMNRLRVRLQGPDAFEQYWGASSVTEGLVRVRYRRATRRVMPPEPAFEAPPGEDRAGRAYARMARHAGEWVGEMSSGDQVGLTLEVVSGGTALLEVLEVVPGHTMATVYHRDGDQLMLTHYCSSRSQPRMRTATIPEDLSRLRFEGFDATNVPAATGAYMKNAEWEFLGPDHFRQTWNQDLIQKAPMVFDYRRGRPTRGAFAARAEGDGGADAPAATPGGGGP